LPGAHASLDCCGDQALPGAHASLDCCGDQALPGAHTSFWDLGISASFTVLVVQRYGIKLAACIHVASSHVRVHACMPVPAGLEARTTVESHPGDTWAVAALAPVPPRCAAARTAMTALTTLTALKALTSPSRTPPTLTPQRRDTDLRHQAG
jgi:hypothetical protein